MGRKRNILLCVLAALAWVGIAAGVFSLHFKTPSAFWERIIPVPQDGERVSVLVEPGMNGHRAALAFEEQGALKGAAKDLERWLIRFGVDRRLRPGRYNVIRSDAWLLARQLQTAQPALLRMTVIPGMDLFSIQEMGDRESWNQALLADGNYPQGLREKLPKSEASRLAFLLPETYFVVEQTPQDLTRAASSAWWDRFAVSADVLSPQELQRDAVIASMVEREVLHEPECPRVAGVIRNRLKRGMPLQIDATVIYAWRLRGRRLTRVLNSDLAVDSPYNTYRTPGLPPHPICVPGAAAWAAALEPEKNDYYYYVAGKNGWHYFAKTYAEHLANVKRARTERGS